LNQSARDTVVAAFPSARILIVDDAEANVRVLERVLQRAGYEKVEALTDSSAGLESFLARTPDILLVDLHMPGIDGFEFIERVTASGSRPAEEFVPIVVLTGDVDPDVKLRALSIGAKDFLTKPLDRTEVLLRIGNLLEMKFLHDDVREHNRVLEKRVKNRTEHLWTAVQDLEGARDEVRQSHEETVSRLSIAAEFRDEETSQHIHRMSRYCEMLARRVGFDEGASHQIRVASQMHDVGKIGIPDDILLKPGRFTPEERSVMERHSLIGHEILANSKSKLLQLAASIALHHHERIDGKGYPTRLAGTAIPVEGRIAAIADVFDALTTDRIYRKAFPVPTAISMLREGGGTQFDAELLDVFLDLLPEVMALRERMKDRESSKHAALR
jgi:putative two-component system response regulator